MSEPVLKIENLNKSFGKFQALKNVSFEVPAGKIIGLVGANGAGKSTIMKSIMGIISYDSGTIKVNGEQITMSKREPLAKVGALIESPGLYPFMSGWDNLKLYADVAGTSDDQMQKIIRLVGAEGFINKKVKGYSFGMKQRTGIALAMINMPDLLILDEPLNGLDPVGIREMRDALKAVRDAGKAILISSHLLRELEVVADDYVFIDHGEIIPTAEVMAEDTVDLEEAFFNVVSRRRQSL